jgi:disulfide bond formation protein DsbB
MKQLFSLTPVWLLILTVGLTACGGNLASAKEETVVAGDPAAGQVLFSEICVTCHGPDGRGLPGLGKNLVSSDFVAAQSDPVLVAFITAGRDPDDPLNTTGVRMPPKGGHPALSEQDLYDIVSYLRQLQKE